jgi:hypothetical protein
MTLKLWVAYKQIEYFTLRKMNEKVPNAAKVRLPRPGCYGGAGLPTYLSITGWMASAQIP